MTKPIEIVIDADIARSAGETEHPVSSSSRQLLLATKEHGHKIVFCRTLLDEWKKHQSNFSKKWLAAMFATRRISKISHNNQTKETIEKSALSQKEKEISEKDSHLVDAALETDKFIASNDANARNAFSKLAKEKKPLKKISWTSPKSEIDDLKNFLSDTRTRPKKWGL